MPCRNLTTWPPHWLQYGAEWDKQSETANVLPLIQQMQATLDPYFAPDRVGSDHVAFDGAACCWVHSGWAGTRR